MSDLNTILIAVAIMVPITLLTKKLLKGFDNIDPKNDDK